jgi:hypothetical protein
MIYYLVKLQHHHVTEEFGTLGPDDPYDHYIGDTIERTNLRYTVVNDKELEDLIEQFVPDDPFDFEDIFVMCEFQHDYEVQRFIKCMKEKLIG